MDFYTRACGCATIGIIALFFLLFFLFFFVVFWDCRAASVHLFCKFTILCLWLRGWGSGCVGRVGPIKDSLTYRPSSQGWASRVLPLIICLLCGVCMFCVGCLVGFLVSFFSF